MEALGPLNFQELPINAGRGAHRVFSGKRALRKPSLAGARETSRIHEFPLGRPGSSLFGRPQLGLRGPDHTGDVLIMSPETGLSAESVDSGGRRPRLHLASPLPAMLPQASHITSWCLGFPICSRGKNLASEAHRED